MSPRCVTIGNATLYQADNSDIVDIIENHDLLLTDPPYGIGESKNKNRGGFVNGKRVESTIFAGNEDWDLRKYDCSDFIPWINRCQTSVIWGGNYFGMPASARWLVWDKQNFSSDFSDCELAWSNQNKGSVRIFRHMWNGMLRASEKKTPRVHPTQKPVKLMEWCIDLVKPVSSVLDPFMGSGSTGVACVNMGISFTGIEKDTAYFEIACERIRAASDQYRLAL